MEDFNNVLYSLVGEKLKDLRLKKGLNQSELSDKISNIGRTSISNIEKGKQQPPLHVMYLICNQLDVDIHSILPTYSDVIKEIDKKNQNEVLNYIEKRDLNEETLKALQELYNLKSKK